MNRIRTIATGIAAASVLLLAATLLHCSDDPAGWAIDGGAFDGSSSETGGFPPIPDAATVPDTLPPDAPVWPDVGLPSPDSTATPDSYSYRGTPFGCADHADCFGMQCCPTPWGVKLCAASCAP